MTDTIRAFIAFELPKNCIAALSNVQDALKAGRFNVKWVRLESIHLTLKFLGNISVGDVERIAEILSSVGEISAIELEIKGLGVFPTIKRPNVIWAGLSGETHRLIGLQRQIDDLVEPLGFPKEKRPFKGHLTLGRVRGSLDSKRLAAAMASAGRFEACGLTADRLVLFKSDLKPGGAVYTELAAVELSASSQQPG